MRYFSFYLSLRIQQFSGDTIPLLVSLPPISAQQRTSCFLLSSIPLVAAAAAEVSTFHSNTKLSFSDPRCQSHALILLQQN